MKWFEGSIVLRAIRRLIGRANQSWRALAGRTPNWAMGLGMLLTVAGFLVWRLTGLQPQKAQAVGEISEARLFQKNCAQDPLANRYAGIHSKASGFGVFIYDADTGQERAVGEVPQTKFAWSYLNFAGWSPDGSLFALTLDGKHIDWCDGRTGRKLGQSLSRSALHTLAWLGNGWVTGWDDNHALQVIHSQPGAAGSDFVLPPLTGAAEEPRSLSVWQTNTVLWLASNGVWELTVDTGARKKIWSDPTNRPIALSVSAETGQAVLCCRGPRTDLLYALDLNSPSPMPARLLAEDKGISDVAAIGDTNGFAYCKPGGGRRMFYVKANATAGMNALELGNDSCFSGCRGRYLYFKAQLTNEPPSLWQYDMLAERWNNVFPPWPKPLGQARLLFSCRRAVVNARGHAGGYTMLPAANYTRGKKYPVLMGVMNYDWASFGEAIYAQTTANAGAYFVAIDQRWRVDMKAEAIEENADDAYAIYQQLIQNPNVDKDRIFVFAMSAGGLYLRKLVAEHPGLWRGLIAYST
ncbi:MAG TPA: prolyl oligopeptidase family serine peptidase, partial [Verrucomicrobiae bacterium]